MKNTIKYLGICVALAMPFSTFAQEDPEEDLNALIGIRLDAAEIKLEDMGYELAHNSFFRKEETWWHSATNSCVTITHDSKRNDQTVLTVGEDDSSKCPTATEAPADSETIQGMQPAFETPDTMELGTGDRSAEGH